MYVLERIDQLVSEHVAVPAYDVLDVIEFLNIKMNEIDCILWRCVWALVCSRLSVLCADVVVLFVDGLLWYIFVSSLTNFRR